MSDLENQLRATLERKADEAISSAENAMPRQIVRRVRRRQARTTILAGVTLAALVLGSVIGIRTFLEPETLVRPLEPAGDPFTVPDSPMASFLVASGKSAGEAWELVAFEDERGPGLEVRTAGSASGTGDFTVPEQRTVEVSGRSFGTPPNVEQLIFGVAISEAEGVRLDFHVGGRTVGRVIPLPSSFNEDLKVIVIETSAQGQGDIVLMDSEGREIAREPYISVPPPFQPGDPIHQLDHFGNAIGQIPAEKVFSPPPPPGTTEEGYVWTPPGLDAPTDDIRGTARAPLVSVRPEVREWWEGRPEEGATDEAFLDWWSAYPVTEELPGA
jgi:hypothetical protein